MTRRNALAVLILASLASQSGCSEQEVVVGHDAGGGKGKGKGREEPDPAHRPQKGRRQ